MEIERIGETMLIPMIIILLAPVMLILDSMYSDYCDREVQDD